MVTAIFYSRWETGQDRVITTCSYLRSTHHVVQRKNSTTSKVRVVLKPAASNDPEMLFGFIVLTLPRRPFPDKLPS